LIIAFRLFCGAPARGLARRCAVAACADQEKRAWADLIVAGKNPLDDVRHMRENQPVREGGAQAPALVQTRRDERK